MFKKIKAFALAAILILVSSGLVACLDLSSKNDIKNLDVVFASLQKATENIYLSKSEYLEIYQQNDEVSFENKGSFIFSWNDKHLLDAYELTAEQNQDYRHSAGRNAQNKDTHNKVHEKWFPNGAYISDADGKYKNSVVKPLNNLSYINVVNQLKKLKDFITVTEDSQYEELYDLDINLNMKDKKIEASSYKIEEALKNIVLYDVPEHSLLNSVVQIKLRLDKESDILAGMDVVMALIDSDNINKENDASSSKSETENKQLKAYYELYVVFKDYNNKDIKPETPQEMLNKQEANKIENLKKVAAIENKNANLPSLAKVYASSQLAFDQINIYDTLSDLKYNLAIENSQISGEVKTSGSEYYEDNKYLYYIGKETRFKDGQELNSAIAVNDEYSFEKALTSLNNLKNQNTESKEEVENGNSYSTAKGWRLIQNKLNSKYYASLLELFNKYAADFSVKEADEKDLQDLKVYLEENRNTVNDADKNKDDQSVNKDKEDTADQKGSVRAETEVDNKILIYSIKENKESVFALLKNVIGSNMDRFISNELDIDLNLVYDGKTKNFILLKIKIKSVQNNALDIEAIRSFSHFRTGEVLQWPVDN